MAASICVAKTHTHLHRHETVIDKYFLGEKVGSNSGLVLVGELFVHILVHKRCLANTRVAACEHQEVKSVHVISMGLPTIAEDNDLMLVHEPLFQTSCLLFFPQAKSVCVSCTKLTFKRTFFRLEDIVAFCI